MSIRRKRNYFKMTAALLPIFLLIQLNLPVFSQTGANIGEQVAEAEKELRDGLVNPAAERLQRLSHLVEKRDRHIKARVYILLGICREKSNNKEAAANFYKKARTLMEKKPGKQPDKQPEKKLPPIHREITAGLKIYMEYFEPEQLKKEISAAENVIEKVKSKEKKKFPWLLVAGGALLVSVLALLVLKKKEKKQYTLEVTRGSGVEGSPAGGTYKYNEGETVSYSYNIQDGYGNLTVRLDGVEVSSSGSFQVSGNRTLEATATANDVSFIVDNSDVEIEEGGRTPFSVRLSAQPAGEVAVTVARVEGDTDINVLIGASLVFNTTNWNTYQGVILEAVQDGDSENGQAVIRISASGIPDKDITVTEIDGDTHGLPGLTILRPKNGDTLSGMVTIEAEVASVERIAEVEFYVDDNLVGTDTRESYKYEWDTKTVADGYHKITVKAYDEENRTAREWINVTVDNSQDSPPEIRITSVSDNQLIWGNFNFETTASDDNGITKVEYYVDNTLIETYTAGNTPWSNINHSKYYNYSPVDGTLPLRAIAYDTMNQTGEANITLRVTRPPSAEIVYPTHNAVVKGTITIQANISDSDGLAEVKYSAGFHGQGTVWETSADTAPYSVKLDTTQLSNGEYLLRLYVRDTVGAFFNTSVNITIEN